MVVDVSNGGNSYVFHHRHHWSCDGLEDWADDGLLVDLCVALVGDGMGHSLDNGHWSHIGLVVHNGSHMLDNGHHRSHMADHRHYGRHMFDYRHNGSHMLDDGRDDRLVVELREALMGGGNGCTVNHSAHLGNNWCSHHMMFLDETRRSCGNGGQGTDGNLFFEIRNNKFPLKIPFQLLTKRNIFKIGFFKFTRNEADE